jgi:large subunit ribosomal protein L15
MDLKSVTLKGHPTEVRKRIGRGVGSGLGKTSGRGHKGWGQRSGASRRPGYEGGQMPLYRRVPKRGFTNARFRTDYTVLNVDLLEAFDAGATVDLEAVLARGLTRRTAPLFKVLGNGKLTRPLTVRAQKFSKSAAEKIRSVGGTVIELDEQGRVREAAPEAPPEPKKAPAKSAPAKAAPPAAEGGGEEEKPAKAAKKPKSPPDASSGKKDAQSGKDAGKDGGKKGGGPKG